MAEGIAAKEIVSPEGNRVRARNAPSPALPVGVISKLRHAPHRAR